MEDNELMGSMKVSKAVAKMAAPSVISSLVTVVYNMADTFFVGQTGDALQVAAVSLTNPIFILMMAFANMFGMGGSAVASMALGEQKEKRAKNVSAFVLSCLYFLWYFLKKSRILSLSPRYFQCRDGILVKICSIGLPTAIFSALMSVSTIVLNQILVAYGNAPVAAIGIVFKANMFITFLQMGLANGVQPMLGYNYGAGNEKRFREIERFTKSCCLIVGIASVLLYYFCRESIIRIFINDEEVIRYGVQMLIGYMLSGPVIGILFMNMNCLQSVEHAFPATVLSVLRQGLLLIPLLYLLDALFGMNGVIYGQSITDYIAVGLSIIIWRKVRRGLDMEKKPAPAAG